jgi:hypothetical protein
MHFSFDDGYSALVAWLKTLLPIVALGLLSTIFLFSGKVDVTQSLPYAEHNVAEIIREQRISPASPAMAQKSPSQRPMPHRRLKMHRFLRSPIYLSCSDPPIPVVSKLPRGRALWTQQRKPRKSQGMLTLQRCQIFG